MSETTKQEPEFTAYKKNEAGQWELHNFYATPVAAQATKQEPFAWIDTKVGAATTRKAVAEAWSRTGAVIPLYAAPVAAQAEPLAVEALEFLLLAVITHADKDYAERAVVRAVRALQASMPGWEPPVHGPWDGRPFTWVKTWESAALSASSQPGARE